jgi:hypothetical protein
MDEQNSRRSREVAPPDTAAGRRQSARANGERGRHLEDVLGEALEPLGAERARDLRDAACPISTG